MLEYENSVFIKSPDKYTRDLDIIGNANKLTAEYLSLQTGKSFDECLEFVENEVSAIGTFPLKPIDLKVLRRKENGDRIKDIIPFDKLINYALKTKSIIAPNLVVYDNSEKNLSLTADYLEGGLAKRGIIKKTGFNAKQNGNMDLFQLCHNEEYSVKIYINSVSGAHCNPHNPFYFRVVHSSLTSNTRAMVSYSNASTERFLSGNRHFYSVDVIIENILFIIRNTDYTELNIIIKKYNLYIPTAKDVFDVIKYSVDFYMHNFCAFINLYHTDLLKLIDSLNPLQRAIFVYSGDFFHIAKYNESLVKDILTDYISEVSIPDDIFYSENPDKIIKDSNGDINALASIFCSEILSGNTPENLKVESPANYKKYADSVKHINETDKKYEDFYLCLFCNEHLPTSIYKFPTSIRRSVVGSDTDSTMFTVQQWVEFYFGEISFGEPQRKIAALMCYLNTQLIAHWLATMSKQIGVETKNLYRLKMKNEFSFPIFIRANIAKHYVTLTDSREGNVYLIPEIEIKGVNMKNSKVPREIMDGLSNEIHYILSRILDNKGVDIYPLMQRMANLEHVIIKSLELGEVNFLSRVNISNAEAYKKPMSSNYMHYDLWLNVFESKYGVIEKPPFQCVKVVTTLDKPKKVNAWIESLDKDTSAKFQLWLNKFIEVEEKECGLDAIIENINAGFLNEDITEDEYQKLLNGINVNETEEMANKEFAIVNPKKKLEMLLLPLEVFESGLPKEFIQIVDIRRVVSELLNGHYIFLTMLGFYIKNKHNIFLLSDNIPYVENFGLPGNLHKGKKTH